MIDIRKRKKNEWERSLRKEAYELAQIGYWELDLNTNQFFWSEETKRLHGVGQDYTPDPITALSFYNKGNSCERIVSAFSKAKAEGISFELELSIETTRNRERWIQVLGSPEMVDGKCVRIYGCIRDITERKETEIKLQESEKKLEESLKEQMKFSEIIFNSMPGLFCMINRDLNFVKVNKRFMNFFELTETKLTEVEPFSMFKGREKKRMLTMVEEVFKTGHSDIETVIRAGEEQKNFYINGKLLEQNGEKYILANGIDITDRVKTQKNNEVLLQEIHHRVKNNLAIISGLLQLEMDELKGRQEQLSIQRSITRIHSMAKVHELLYATSDFSTINVREYLKELSNEIRHTFERGEKVRIQFDIEDFEMNVNEAIPLGLLMNELLTNSIKYAFNGYEGRIEIAITKSEGMYKVCYRDNGIGFEGTKKPVLQNAETLGMNIIYTLLQQLAAEYKLDTDNRFALEFEFEQKVKGSHSSL